MPKRREFPAKVKAQAALRADGKCECCEARLSVGNVHYDHVTPDALGGEPVLENCECLCKTCHKDKTTKEDVPRIAKAKRQRAKHLGTTARSKAILPGSKGSGWKKRLDGSVVAR